jgi:hypothetical protein
VTVHEVAAKPMPGVTALLLLLLLLLLLQQLSSMLTMLLFLRDPCARPKSHELLRPPLAPTAAACSGISG